MLLEGADTAIPCAATDPDAVGDHVAQPRVACREADEGAEAEADQTRREDRVLRCGHDGPFGRSGYRADRYKPSGR